jgi:hypothetical protein
MLMGAARDHKQHEAEEIEAELLRRDSDGTLLNGMTQPRTPLITGSQNRPFSGHYLGSGESVENGVSTPYTIALDVFDSGKITFVCTGWDKNQRRGVAGQGVVDSEGKVVLQNQFGATGEGTIAEKVMKAGGQTSDGSVLSHFTALKQD